jgi:hypothetical protein
MASSSEPSRKQGREEEDDDESCCRRLMKKVLPPLPNEPKEVLPHPPDNPVEALVPQPMAFVSAPPLNADKATLLVNLFCDAFVKLRKVAVHLRVPVPNDPLQRTVKDYAFKIIILAGDLEKECSPPLTTTAVMMVATPTPAPTPTLTLTVGLLRR